MHKLRVGQHRGDGLRFRVDERRLVVGDAEDQRACAAPGGLLLAARVDAGARRIRHRARVGDVLLAVEERMERHVVQRAVRHDDQPAAAQLRPHWRQQLLEDLVQVRLRRRQQRAFEGLEVIRAQSELRELELQHPDLRGDPRHERDGRHFDPVAIDEAEDDAVFNRKELDERRLGGQRLADGLERIHRRGEEIRLRRTGERQLADRARHLLLARADLALKCGELLVGVVARPQLFEFDQVVVPVQLFAQLTNRVGELAL